MSGASTLSVASTYVPSNPNPITWISEERLYPFLRAVEGDEAAAIALYDWHAELLAASFGVMHHFEVLVRNAIDRQRGDGQPQTQLKDTWLLDFQILQPGAIKQVIIAVERLERGKAITRGRVVAGLSFGFWSGLFGGRYEELWRQSLRHAFPRAMQRKDVSKRLDDLRRFRNRLARHDNILDQRVDERLQQMIEVAYFVDPAAARWLHQRSAVTRILQRRPGGTVAAPA